MTRLLELTSRASGVPAALLLGLAVLAAPAARANEPDSDPQPEFPCWGCNGAPPGCGGAIGCSFSWCSCPFGAPCGCF